MTQQERRETPGQTAFAWKVRRAKWALVFEQVWRRLWIVLGVAAVFVALSYLGLWPRLGDTAHLALLGLFAVAAGVALIHMVRVRWPSHEDAVRRIERVSGIPHRPASSYEDTLSAATSDPATQSLWQAHQARMAALLSKLRPGAPAPRTDRFDPFAMRALALLTFAVATLFLGPAAWQKIQSAFTLASTTRLAEARLDAWITPPGYTGRPPVMLADGGTPIAKQKSDPSAKPPQVPAKSILIVRSSGTDALKLALDVTPEGSATSERVEAVSKSDGGDVQELRHEITKSGEYRVTGNGGEVATWRLAVIPDKLPTISLSRPPEMTPRGSMKLTYKVEDDYGVASAEAKLEKVAPRPADPKTAWAQSPPPKGPRPPLQRPPKLTLRLPGASAKTADAHTYFEFASHPWAGLKVLMTLEAKDVAGQVGRSSAIEMVLPEKVFTKPLARALVEQRRKLIDDPRYRPVVIKALDALTLEPDGFIDDVRVYLGIRSVYHRLQADRSRAGMRSSIEQLWHIALRIEDGRLSDAERALKDAQDKLAKALEEGASEEEIKKLMAELKQAMSEFMRQLAQESGDQGEQPNGQDQQNQMLSQDDLDRMMKSLEEMTKSGAREEAQQLLSEMRDLMERLQSGKQNEQQAKQNQEMMKMMDELGDMVGDQQQLMDDTFNEQREGAGEDGPNSRPPPGMKGMGSEPGQEGQGGAPPGQGPSQQGQAGQKGQGGQQGQRGQQGQGQQQGRGRPSLSDLRERQRELRERLGKLEEEMRQKGAGAADKLGGARGAMEGAERSIEEGDLEGATDQQAQALDQMREGAESMAQQMLRNMPQRFGQSGDTPRDPLGRPQRSQGPDLGTSVKVPDQIDAQRAREILEELRRRLGQSSRGTIELDYLERLLKRF